MKKKKQMNKTVVFSGPRKDRQGCISIPYVKSISSQETKQAEKHERTYVKKEIAVSEEHMTGKRATMTQSALIYTVM